MDIWNIYHKSFVQELNADEIDFLDTMIQKYPYFAMARFLKAKAIPTTDNISLASSHAPSRPLFKAFMEGRKSVRETISRTVMDKRKNNIETSNFQQKHKLFNMVTPGNQGSTELKDMPFAVLLPQQELSFQGFLDALIKEKIQRYITLSKQIKGQIRKNKEEAQLAKQSIKTKELIQRFLDNNPKIKRTTLGKEKESSVKVVDKSVNLDEEIVSETLAKIHLKQNNTKEALRIYKRLSLLFPEKSAYFDAQISGIIHT